MPEGDGVRAFFLDGREMVDGGPMSLRTALVTESAGPSEVVDPRVCECCSTDAAANGDGALVVYRDRGETEVRDIFLAAGVAGSWSDPRSVHRDGWTIAGCPVNGPEISIAGDFAAVAWFTAANDRAQVRVALSQDGGTTFAPPITVDDDGPLGRVAVLADEGGAWLSWMAVREKRAAVQLARVSSSGEIGEIVTAAETATARTSGFPRLGRSADALYLAWVGLAEDSQESRIRVARIPFASRPDPS